MKVSPIHRHSLVALTALTLTHSAPVCSRSGPDWREATAFHRNGNQWLPAGTPKEIMARTNEVFVNALNRRKVKEYLSSAGSVPFPTTSEELMKFQIAEHDKRRKVMRAAGIQPEQ